MSASPSSSRPAAMPRPPLSSLALALSLTLLSACTGQKPPEQTEAPPKAAAVAPPPSACQASASWITRPTMPAEVASSETFCDFYQFSWQWFLAQVSPADANNPSGDRVFETNRLLDPKVSSGQCQQAPITGRANAARLLTLRDIKPSDFELEQADGSVLYDQNGNILYYNVWYSQAECDSTPQGFAPGTLELKVAWKVLPQPDPTYFTMQATLPGGSAPSTLGLVGFHLVNWTSKHPEMIWATFEHKSNAPLCNGTSAAPANGWSLTSADAANCLAQNAQPGASGPPSDACASFKFNTADAISGTPPPTGTPDNICRQFANGNQPGNAINGNDNAANLLAIQQLNAALVGPQGLLTQLPADDPMAIWANYEMIGGLWTKDGAASGNLPVTTAAGPGDPNSPQRGSLELANMTMETFEQGDTSFVPNCFGCHQYKPATPLTVSHITKKLFSLEQVKTPAAGASAATASAPPPADAQGPAKQ